MNDGAGILTPADAVWEEPARAERIELRRLSIRALVDAFAAALQRASASSSRAGLSRWGQFRAMAAHARLLLPPEHEQAKTACE